MERIVLPGTDLATSRLGFGTASLHHLWRGRERQALLGAALAAGITHFDTAPLYGEGLAERELGRFAAGRRDHVTLATKFGLPARPLLGRQPLLLYAARGAAALRRRLLPGRATPRRRDLSPAAVEAGLDASLRALRTDWVDLLLLHEPDPAEHEAVARLEDWLRLLRASGRARLLGLAGSAAACVAVARRFPGLFDVLQVEDSLSRCEADALPAAGHPVQITYGWYRTRAADTAGLDGSQLFERALARNPRGMLLVSTRRPERLPAWAAAAARGPRP